MKPSSMLISRQTPSARCHKELNDAATVETVTTYLTHQIMLSACCAEGARCNSPGQRAGWAKQGQRSAESAQYDRLCANVALVESGALNMPRPHFQRS